MKNRKSFTLLELLVVVAIISIMSGISIADYNSKRKQDIFENNVMKFASDIRTLQNMAMSVIEVEHNNVYDVCTRYGIKLIKQGASSDYNAYKFVCERGSGVEFDIKTIQLTAGAKFNISDSGAVSIYFTPPVPELKCYNNNDNNNSARCNFQITNSSNSSRSIIVSNSGLVKIENN